MNIEQLLPQINSENMKQHFDQYGGQLYTKTVLRNHVYKRARHCYNRYKMYQLF